MATQSKFTAAQCGAKAAAALDAFLAVARRSSANSSVGIDMAAKSAVAREQTDKAWPSGGSKMAMRLMGQNTAVELTGASRQRRRRQSELRIVSGTLGLAGRPP